MYTDKANVKVRVFVSVLFNDNMTYLVQLPQHDHFYFAIPHNYYITTSVRLTHTRQYVASSYVRQVSYHTY